MDQWLHQGWELAITFHLYNFQPFESYTCEYITFQKIYKLSKSLEILIHNAAWERTGKTIEQNDLFLSFPSTLKG